VERGRDFWAGPLKKIVANSDWEALNKELVPQQKKKAGGAIVAALPPMRLWASSFSGKTISEKTTAMDKAIAEVEEAAAALEIAATGESKGGFFGFLGGTVKMDASKRSELAQTAYKKGVIGFNKYIDIANDGIGNNFTPVDRID
jgi:hypothetical protein